MNDGAVDTSPTIQLAPLLTSGLEHCTTMEDDDNIHSSKEAPSSSIPEEQAPTLIRRHALRRFVASLSDPTKDWIVTIAIGFFTVSHWRGLWTLFDIWFCDQPEDASLTKGNTFCFSADAGADNAWGDKRLRSAILTYLIGIACTIVGTGALWLDLWTARDGSVTRSLAVLRFLTVYILGMAANCTWRAIWYISDHLIYPDNLLASWWLTNAVGAAGAFLLCSGGSLLAPPAIFLLDGPDINPPPLGVTIVSTYFSVTLPATTKPPTLSLWIRTADVIVSFFLLPIFVVWFWRGGWMLMDQYLWGFSEDEGELNLSLLWSTLIGLFCSIITSEPVMYHFGATHKLKAESVARVRTYILAWGGGEFLESGLVYLGSVPRRNDTVVLLDCPRGVGGLPDPDGMPLLHYGAPLDARRGCRPTPRIGECAPL